MKDLFFAYCPENGFEFHETLKDALADAGDAVQNYLDEDGWREEVTVVCVGEITHRAGICDQVFPDGEIDEDGIDEAGDYWEPGWDYKCNYKMLPVNKRLPAPDAPEQEPAAWIVRHPRFCGKFTDDKEIAAHWEREEQGCTAPLYLHAQSAPDAAALVETLNVVKAVLESDDPAIADTVWVPGAPETLLDHVCSALDAYRKQGGGV